MFWAQKQQNSHNIHKIGLSEDEQHYCIVYNLNNIIDTIWEKKPCDIKTLINQINSPNKRSIVIRPVTYQYIWRKYLFLPSNYNELLIHKNIIHILKKELPANIQDVYFDYQCFKSAEKKTTKIIIYAIKKEFANQLILNQYTKLDCELYCYARAFHHLINNDQAQHDPIYHIENKIIHFKYNELYIENKQNNTIENNHFIYSIDHINFDNKILNQALYIKALGAYLWNGTE